MFFSCFKCKESDDNEDIHYRPRTRNTSQKSATTSIPVPDNDVNTQSKTLKDIQQEVLAVHNEYRAKHGSHPLVLSNNLNSFAMEWAKVS